MGKITATKVNESYFYLKVNDPDMIGELDMRFAIHRDGYMFMPIYKCHKWDGKDHYFNKVTHYLPVGLVEELKSFALKHGHKLEFEGYEASPEWISRERLRANNKQILAGSKYEVRDYQEEAVYAALNNKLGVLECCTSSGKSLMIYLILRNLMMEKGLKHMILIVPSIMLVTQMYKDFIDYGWSDIENWAEMQDKDHKPTFKKPILITTWQSLQNCDVDFFGKQQAVIVDECLDGETLISTPEGDKRIKDIKAGDLVISFNEKTREFENKRVLEVFENHKSGENANMLEIELENGKKVQITENHPVLTENRGWVRAGDLTEEDSIVELV